MTHTATAAIKMSDGSELVAQAEGQTLRIVMDNIREAMFVVYMDHEPMSAEWVGADIRINGGCK